MNELPFITALCPTYRRPELLANSLWLWERQTYPKERRCLIIVDDGGTFMSQLGDSWKLFAFRERCKSLPEKYNQIAELAPTETEAFLVWEDDDTYLPEYVSSYAKAFANGAQLVKPSVVLSDYPRKLVKEPAAGRFHASLGFTKRLFDQVGGWPLTRLAQFDQMFIHTLLSNAAAADPWENMEPQYIFGWHTGRPHGQSAMRGPMDTEWWERASQQYREVHHDGMLVGKPVPHTLRFFEELSIKYPLN